MIRKLILVALALGALASVVLGVRNGMTCVDFHWESAALFLRGENPYQYFMDDTLNYEKGAEPAKSEPQKKVRTPKAVKPSKSQKNAKANTSNSSLITPTQCPRLRCGVWDQ